MEGKLRDNHVTFFELLGRTGGEATARQAATKPLPDGTVPRRVTGRSADAATKPKR
jgi:hypothetical protein